MNTGRFIFRGFAQQGWRAATYALANSGAAPTPVAVVTTRLAIIGTSRERMEIEGTSGERMSTRGTSRQRLSISGSSSI